MISQKEKKEKGVEAEKEFQEWLEHTKLPYWYIQQDSDTFSSVFGKYNAKRPDFMILIPHVGFIIVDVKHKKPAIKSDVFQINEKETEQHCNLQNYFNLQVWYVFGSEGDHYNNWYWIPVSKVLEFSKSKDEGKIISCPNPDDNYCEVSMKKFIKVPKDGDIGYLFTGISKLIGHIDS